MSQTHPTHEELVSEERMLTDGVENDTQWCDRCHSDVFGTEGQPHVFVLFDMQADSMNGHRVFLGVFESPASATGWVIAHYNVWRRDPNLPLEPWFNLEEVAIIK